MKNKKFRKKMSQHFVGFTVFKMTGLISWSFLLEKIGRKCSTARDIGKTKNKKSFEELAGLFQERFK